MAQVDDFTGSGQFLKVNEDKRLVTGWASVCTKGGKPLVDHHGDIIDIENLREVVEDFMDSERTGGYMHEQKSDGSTVRIGKIVGSLIVDEDVAKSLGMDAGTTGWLITMRVESDTVWKKVKDGTLRAFSIGGRGYREPA